MKEKPIKQLRTVRYWPGEEEAVERIEDHLGSLPKSVPQNDLFKRLIEFYLDMSPEEQAKFHKPIRHRRTAKPE